MTEIPIRPISPAPAMSAMSPAVSLLFVDDDPLIRELTAEALERLGYRVTQAEDSAGALAALQSGPPFDLLITDYSMPGMTGLDLILTLRRTHPSLPVLLLTGHADEAMERSLTATQNPATALLRKPVLPRALATRVESLLAQSRTAASG